MISDFLLRYQIIINVLGGGMILFMGVRLLLRKGETVEHKTENVGLVKMFLSSFAIGITNPAAILTFLFAFSYFGITGVAGIEQEILLVCGVFTGTYIWWGVLTATANYLKKKAAKFNFEHIGRIFGGILCLFGIAVFARLLLEALQK